MKTFLHNLCLMFPHINILYNPSVMIETGKLTLIQQYLLI